MNCHSTVHGKFDVRMFFTDLVEQPLMDLPSDRSHVIHITPQYLGVWGASFRALSFKNSIHRFDKQVRVVNPWTCQKSVHKSYLEPKVCGFNHHLE